MGASIFEKQGATWKQVGTTNDQEELVYGGGFFLRDKMVVRRTLIGADIDIYRRQSGPIQKIYLTRDQPDTDVIVRGIFNKRVFRINSFPSPSTPQRP